MEGQHGSRVCVALYDSGVIKSVLSQLLWTNTELFYVQFLTLTSNFVVFFCLGLFIDRLMARSQSIRSESGFGFLAK